MKPLSIKSLLLVSTLFMPWLQAQDGSQKVREIEQKVLQKQYQNAVQALVGSAREAAVSPDLIGRRLQWLAMVDARIEAGGKRPAAKQEEVAKNAETINDLAWTMITSPDAGKRHPEIALKLADIAIEMGGENDVLKPRVLDTRARALFLLGRQDEAIAGQEKAVAAATVAEEKAGFEVTLALYRKNELPQISPPAAAPAAEALAGTPYILAKLRTIVIPMIDFEDVTVEEAVDFLRLRATELDKAELDPARKGVNFVIQRPAAKPAPAAGSAPGEKVPTPVADPGMLRIKELRLRNVPLAVALKYICDSVRLRYKVDDFAVTLVHLDAPEGLFTRTFRVPLDFSSKLIAAGSGAKDLTARPPIIELLKSAGINFGEGSSATLAASGTLMVTNTPSELDKLELLIEAVTVKSDWTRKPSTAPAAPAEPDGP